MTQHISQIDPRTLTTEEIHAEIEGFKALAVNVLRRWSALLAELKSRREESIMFDHPVLKFWESINSNILDAQAAVLLADKKDGRRIKAVLPLKPAEQLVIARGAPVAVAVRADTGAVKFDDMPISRMDDATLKRAFGPDGIRTVYEQAEMIREEGKVKRIGPVTVLQDEMRLKIGNQKLGPEDLKAPLAALGYTLTLTRSMEPAE